MSTATPPVRQGAHAATSPALNSPDAVEEAERAMEVAAAQLRLVTDRRLGKQTPEWVKALADEKPGAAR